jgi:hypothetical protein
MTNPSSRNSGNKEQLYNESLEEYSGQKLSDSTRMGFIQKVSHLLLK